MKKELKLAVTPNGPTFQTVTITVDTQTHRGLDFGKSGREFVASNGLRIASYDSPEARFSPLYKTLYVRGSHTHLDRATVTISSAYLPALIDAVKEYNATFAWAPKAPAKPQHIKVSALPVGPTFQNVKVTVLEQSHFLTNFGTETPKGAGEFVASNGVRLASCKDDNVGIQNYIPKRLAGKGIKFTFYVGRNSWQGTLSKTCEISAANWALVLAAIQEYNQKFAAPAPLVYGFMFAANVAAPAAPKAAPKADPCVTLIG